MAKIEIDKRSVIISGVIDGYTGKMGTEENLHYSIYRGRATGDDGRSRSPPVPGRQIFRSILSHFPQGHLES